MNCSFVRGNKPCVKDGEAPFERNLFWFSTGILLKLIQSQSLNKHFDGTLRHLKMFSISFDTIESKLGFQRIAMECDWQNYSLFL